MLVLGHMLVGDPTAADMRDMLYACVPPCFTCAVHFTHMLTVVLRQNSLQDPPLVHAIQACIRRQFEHANTVCNV